METIVEQKLGAIKALMLEHGVEKAYLFGSAARGTARPDSDVDFIIKFPDNMHHSAYADNYFALADALEILLNKHVELVMEKTLKNPYLIQNINQHKVQLL